MNVGVASNSVVAVGGVVAVSSPGEVVLSGAALIVIVAGIVGAVFGTKRKTELDAAAATIEALQGAAVGWEGERNAAMARAERLEAENRLLATENARLGEMTNLASLVESVQKTSAIAADEHKAIIEHLAELERNLTAALDRNTQALTFLATQRHQL